MSRNSSSSESSEDEDFMENVEDLYRSKESDLVRKSARLRKKYNNLAKQDDQELVAAGPAESLSQMRAEAASPDNSVRETGKLSKNRLSPSVDLQVKNKIDTAASASPRRVTFTNDTPVQAWSSSAATTSVKIDVRREAEVEADLVEDMIRAASRNSSRPTSRTEVGAPGAADSRPGSRVDSRADSRAGSRAGKMTRKAFGVDPDTIEEPDRDSPVLTPRARRLEKERRVASLGLSAPKILPAQVVSDESMTQTRLSSPMPGGASSTVTSSAKDKYIVTSLQSFDQIAVKKSKQEKVSKLLARQKRKAEKLEKRKYRGFGQTAAAESDEESDRKMKAEKQERIRKLKLSAARSSHLTQEESDLIASLLQDAESAVLQVQSQKTQEETKTETVDQTYLLEFNESQTLYASHDAYLEEQDFLSGL